MRGEPCELAAVYHNLGGLDHYLAVVGHGRGGSREALGHADAAVAVFERAFAADHPRVVDARAARDALRAALAIQ